VESKPSNFNIKYYQGIIYKRRYLVLAVAVVVIFLFTLMSFLTPKTYEASATVFIEGGSVSSPLLQGVAVTVSLEERIRNLKNMLTSRTMMERVVKKLKLDEKVKNPTQYEALIENLRNSLTVNVRSGGERASDLFFTIAYRGDNPGKVMDLVNTHIEECVAESASTGAADVSTAYEFIEKELQGYKIKLAQSDKAILEFREQHPRMVPQSEGSLAARVENYQNSQTEGNIKLRELERRRESLQKQLSGEKELTVAFVQREGSPQARLNYLNNQLMLLLTKYTDNYPEVIKVKSEIDELQKQINDATEQQKNEAPGARSETAAMNPVYQQLKEDLSKTDTEIESLRARMDEIAKQQQEGQAILRTMPKEQEEWTNLQRDRTVYQGLYDNLLAKLESARLSRDLEQGEKNATFRVIDPPIRPNVPIKPNRVQLILFGLIAGLASGIGAAVGLDLINPYFKSEKEIESGLKLPLLATVYEIVTEADVQATHALDRRVYKATAIYLAIIGILLIEEFMFRYLGISLIKW